MGYGFGGQSGGPAEVVRSEREGLQLKVDNRRVDSPDTMQDWFKLWLLLDSTVSKE